MEDVSTGYGITYDMVFLSRMVCEYARSTHSGRIVGVDVSVWNLMLEAFRRKKRNMGDCIRRSFALFVPEAAVLGICGVYDRIFWGKDLQDIRREKSFDMRGDMTAL